MSVPLPDLESCLVVARRHAERGDWEDVRATITRCAPSGFHPALTVLLAEAYLRLDDFGAARTWLLSAMPALERSGDRVLHRRAVNLLGAAQFELGELEEAEAAFERALELADEHGDLLLTARATNNLGMIANIRGRHQDALTRYRLAVPAYQQVGDSRGLAETLHNIAITYRDAGELDEADECEQRAIEYARRAENRRLVAMAQAGRAELALARAEYAVAEAGARMAATDYVAIGDQVGEADTLRLTARARLARDEADTALAAIDRALELVRPHGIAVVEAEVLQVRAEALARLGDRERARADAAQALALLQRLGAGTEAAALAEWMEQTL
jgi:tetratricopeptide (TPR) repeat protein